MRIDLDWVQKRKCGEKCESGKIPKSVIDGSLLGLALGGFWIVTFNAEL